ncbi:transposable element Tcb1 transposase [Trichonephila clavipes]|nr:transposable element Tcb1 transposase [Trichonephila clavipes]
MPPRRNKEKFQQLTEFERGRIIGLREGEFSYHAIGARVQRNSSTGIFLPEVGSTLIYCYRCTNVGFVNSSTSASPWIACKGAFTQDPLMANHRRMRLQWANEHRASQADWHQVVFSDESRFNLWDPDGHIRVRCYAGERCLPKCVMERHSGLTPGVMVWGCDFVVMSYPICYELRVISIATGTSVKCYSPKSYPSFKASLELSISRIMHAHMALRLFETSVQSNTCNIFLGLFMPSYMSLIEYVWY